jgi:phosphoribosylformylglycinamidine synthase
LKYQRIELAVKPEFSDPFAKHVKWAVTKTLGYPIKDVRIVLVYTVGSDLSDDRLNSFARDVLVDPVLTFYSVGTPVAKLLPPFTWALEVSYKPGVTDNVGHTARDVLRMMTGANRNNDHGTFRVYKSTQYLIDASLNGNEVENIGNEILYNSLIEELAILSRDDFMKIGGFPVKEKHFDEDHVPRADVIDLNIPDPDLRKLSEERVLALTLEEMKYFQSHFEKPEVKKKRKACGIGSEPTDVELEVFAQTQSEHCKHKIFNATIKYSLKDRSRTIKSIFKTYIMSATDKISREKDWLVSVFKDNAGIIRFNEDYNLAFKVETHNSPSALDPYGGAITGIVGCDRDPAGTGLGSRIIAHTDVLCFGDPGYNGDLPQRMMHPRRIMDGVIKGIEDGGNKCGIPTINGGVIFDGSYSGKPLVFCGSVGIMPSVIGKTKTHEKNAEPGDIIVMIGGRIGKDGIHGATFSSEELNEGSPSQAVQIGDPITQKKMLDMLIEARDALLYRGITDNGAGGLSSSVGEMALLAGGALLDLEKAPLKYRGLDPWEILLSEAQERMTLAVPGEKLEQFMRLAERREVLAVAIGEFTDSGYFHVKYAGKTVCYLDLGFLHSNIPFVLEARWIEPEITEKEPDAVGAFSEIITEVVSDLNSCSREPIIRRYDHEVGGKTVIKPLVGAGGHGPSDGGVLAPVAGDSKGFVLSAGINPFYSKIDTYNMAALCVDEALRNAVAVGADPDSVAILDNFCWPDPVYDEEKTADGKFKLAQLVRAAEGLYDTATAYKTPFISGKDSMKNDYKIKNHKISVLPTILISAIGIVPDTTKCVTSDFKIEGDLVYLVGVTGKHMGQSLFYRIYDGESRTVPVVDTGANMKVYRAYHEVVKAGLVVSGHDLSEGGLAVAVAESCIAGSIGACIDLGLTDESEFLSDQELLFSESSGRFLVSVNPDLETEFLGYMKGVRTQKIGKITSEKKLLVTGKAKKGLIDVSVSELTDAFKNPLCLVLGMKV